MTKKFVLLSLDGKTHYLIDTDSIASAALYEGNYYYDDSSEKYLLRFCADLCLWNKKEFAWRFTTKAERTEFLAPLLKIIDPENTLIEASSTEECPYCRASKIAGQDCKECGGPVAK